ncbi:hypothetical protein GCM10020221_34170 [Streptomyces thioluteus]|uniref:Uncharacterized protein n=1 Tax=Streptomyces thioluteus TaxID=66431 RepID=A0ABN3X4M8_STRTU
MRGAPSTLSWTALSLAMKAEVPPGQEGDDQGLRQQAAQGVRDGPGPLAARRPAAAGAAGAGGLAVEVVGGSSS